MCGITALFSNKNIFDDLLESLYHLQHRGQDSFGFAYLDGEKNIEGMYICGDMSGDCPTTTGTGEKATFDMEFLYELSWTRFGNIKLERWDNNRKTWIVQ